MSFTARLQRALPALGVALLLVVATTFAWITFLFYSLNLSLGTHFFAEGPAWIPIAASTSWFILGAAFVYFLKASEKASEEEEGLTTLAEIVFDKWMDEELEREFPSR